MWLFKDLHSRWRLDSMPDDFRSFTAMELHRLVYEGAVRPRAFVRNTFSRRFALVAEVLLANRLISEEKFEEWVPFRVTALPQGSSRVSRPSHRSSH